MKLYFRSLEEEIEPDLTVQSAKTLTTRLLKRFPSDLLESSVDPVLPRDFQATTSTLVEQQIAPDDDKMVRVYQPPQVTTSRGGQISSSGPSQNGLQVGKQ